MPLTINTISHVDFGASYTNIPRCHFLTVVIANDDVMTNRLLFHLPGYDNTDNCCFALIFRHNGRSDATAKIE